MEVVLLGTGSADGWPNPFCTCASCGDARRRGDIRGQTGALVDRVMLIDCGPEIPRAAARFGHRLDDVRTLLFTHAHPDHVGPAALLFRHWTRTPRPLRVIGPTAALELCRPWIAPDDPVSMTTISAGDVVDVDGYRIRAHAANHHGPDVGPALVYDIEDDHHARLLYACDTGELPPSTQIGLRRRKFDIALIEETFGHLTPHDGDHLDLRSFGHTVADLRTSGALTDHTRVIAVHLSHHNPPSPELAQTVRPWGVEIVPDGTVITTGSPAHPVDHPHRTLVLGGARSGKSSHAEGLVLPAPEVTYLATGGQRPDDPEWCDRVARHRAQRPSHWLTIETTDLVPVLDRSEPGDVLLIDCLTLWLTDVLDQTDAWDGDTSDAVKRVDELVESWRHCRARVVAVSNEVGWGVVPEHASGRLFRDLQGRLNNAVARESDQVTLVVSGQPQSLTPLRSNAPPVIEPTRQEHRT